MGTWSYQPWEETEFINFFGVPLQKKKAIRSSKNFIIESRKVQSKWWRKLYLDISNLQEQARYVELP